MIYFVQPLDGGPLKIGFSDDVDRRRAQLEAHYGCPLALLATMDGGRDEEREIHARFSHLRLGRTEQFRPAAEIMAFIGRPLLAGPNPDAVIALPDRWKAQKTTPVRVTEEAIKWARIASGYTGESVAEYLSRIAVERGREDADRLHGQVKSDKPPKGK